MATEKKKFHVKRGDTVLVISGNEKGKQGVIRSIDTEKERAIIEGLNIVTRHVKPTTTNPNGNIVKKEAPIHISNLMLVDPATGEATKTGRKLNEKGKLQRFSKTTQKFIN